MVFALLFVVIFLGEAQTEIIRDCYWLADQLTQSPNFRNLRRHHNYKLLPQGLCGNWKWTIPGSLKKIFRGTEASKTEFPWLAHLNLFGSTAGDIHCGGAIINKRYILTAAHCCELATPPSNLKWFLGNNYYPGNRTVATEKIHIPEGYYNCTGKVLKHDVCVVRLSEEIAFYENVQPICVPLQAEIDQGIKMEVAGFGITDPEKMTSENTLQKKTVTVVGQNLCREKYSIVDAREICTTYGSCHDDSGGPLMMELTIGDVTAYWLLGITSYGAPDCGIGSLSVYMRVTEYIGWILDVMEP